MNGNPANDANPRQPRYAYPPDTTDQIVREPWGTPPPEPSTGGEYYGGDLAGVHSKPPYLHGLGVDGPLSEPDLLVGLQPRYDTRDYHRSIRAGHRQSGTVSRAMRPHAECTDRARRRVRSRRVRLPYFDRYARQSRQVGRSESVGSPYRSWFIFVAPPNGRCAGPAGPHTMGYVTGWNSKHAPVLNKHDPGVRALDHDGARMPSPRRGSATARPAGASTRWESRRFRRASGRGSRSAVKAAKPDAPIIGEAWQRDQVLPLIRGDTADTITDYRSRTPLLAYLGTASARGFADDSASGLSPAILASELAGVLEDEPPAVAGTAFRLLDSHDTERVLWSLTPGATAEEKAVPANLAVGKARLRLAALMQFSLPGAPVIYYGDEVGMTGATDPENRATYPTDGGDQQLAAWYRQLATTQNAQPVLREVTALPADRRAIAFPGLRSDDPRCHRDHGRQPRRHGRRARRAALPADRWRHDDPRWHPAP